MADLKLSGSGRIYHVPQAKIQSVSAGLRLFAERGQQSHVIKAVLCDLLEVQFRNDVLGQGFSLPYGDLGVPTLGLSSELNVLSA